MGVVCLSHAQAREYHRDFSRRRQNIPVNFPPAPKTSAILTGTLQTFFIFQNSSQRQLAVGYTSLHRFHFEPHPSSRTEKSAIAVLSPIDVATLLQQCKPRGLVQWGETVGPSPLYGAAIGLSVQPVALALKAARGPVSEYPHWPSHAGCKTTHN